MAITTTFIAVSGTIIDNTGAADDTVTVNWELMHPPSMIEDDVTADTYVLSTISGSETPSSGEFSFDVPPYSYVHIEIEDCDVDIQFFVKNTAIDISELIQSRS